MPLNLLSICSFLDENKYDIKITQQFVDGAYETFLPSLDNAICLGISCKTGMQIHYGLGLAKKIKEKRPELPIIWGGYHVTALPEQTIVNPYVDIIVRGYGEETFLELIKKLIENKSYEDVIGITFRKKDIVMNNPDRPIKNLNDFPPIPYHLFDVEKYFERTCSRALRYISSRGCPHHCGFCADYVIYEGRWNALSAQRVVEDLKRLKARYDYDSVHFYDSNMFVDEKRIKDICQGVIAENLKFKWLKCNGDASILSRYSSETLNLMKKAGISNIVIGVESGYAPALECVFKPSNLDQVLETIKKLHEHGIFIAFSCMFGFPYNIPKEALPYEHKKELLATMKLISRFSKDYIDGDYYMIFIYTPYPGVKLFGRYKELGLVPPDTFEGWSHINLNESESCPWLSPESLELYKHALQINWFFMHKIKRNMFRGVRNKILRKIASFFDRYFRSILTRRLEEGKLEIPLFLSIICNYYVAKESGIKGFFLKGLSFLKKKGLLAYHKRSPRP